MSRRFWKRTRGRNTATVVRVEALMATIISRVPSTAAVASLLPFSR